MPFQPSSVTRLPHTYFFCSQILETYRSPIAILSCCFYSLSLDCCVRWHLTIGSRIDLETRCNASIYTYYGFHFFVRCSLVWVLKPILQLWSSIKTNIWVLKPILQLSCPTLTLFKILAFVSWCHLIFQRCNHRLSASLWNQSTCSKAKHSLRAFVDLTTAAKRAGNCLTETFCFAQMNRT